MSGAVRTVQDKPDRRLSQRLCLVVPAFIQVGDEGFTAKLSNIVPGGAMLETSAPVVPGGRVRVRCGTISAEAQVIWWRSGRIGVKFLTPLTEAQVEEQLSRSVALQARRASAA